MYYDVVNVKYIEGYKLELTFENGRTGVVDLQEYAKMERVFKKFLDIGKGVNLILPLPIPNTAFDRFITPCLCIPDHVRRSDAA